MNRLTLEQVINETGGRLANSQEFSKSPKDVSVCKPASLLDSRSSDIAFFFSKEYQNDLLKAEPGILITGESFVEPLKQSGLPVWKNSAVVVCADPYWAMAHLSNQFKPKIKAQTEIHSTAVIHPQAKLGESVKIGAYTVVEKDAVIGDGTEIYPHCYIGEATRIGKDCLLYSHVTIYHQIQIASRVRIHSGAVIGADGFGYALKRKDHSDLKSAVIGHEKIIHFGSVRIGDDVEVGANSCIDRGTITDTVIEKQVKIDNDVQIGHNVFIDEGAILCACSGLAGSCRVGKYVYVGGLTGISNKVEVGDGAKIAAMTLVSKNVAPGEVIAGIPQRSSRDHFKVHGLLNQMLKSKKDNKRS